MLDVFSAVLAHMAAIVYDVKFFGLGLIIKSAKSHLNDVAELLEEKYQRRQAFFLLTAGKTLWKPGNSASD